MQQHLMQMQPMMAAYYPNNVTTDHIQQVLYFLPSSILQPFSHKENKNLRITKKLKTNTDQIKGVN